MVTTENKTGLSPKQLLRWEQTKPHYLRERAYLYDSYMVDLAKSLDSKTAEKLSDLLLKIVIEPEWKGVVVKQKTISMFWQLFDDMAPIKIRKDVLDSLKKDTTPSDICFLYGMLLAKLFRMERAEAASSLGKAYDAIKNWEAG